MASRGSWPCGLERENRGGCVLVKRRSPRRVVRNDVSPSATEGRARWATGCLGASVGPRQFGAPSCLPARMGTVFRN